MKLPPEFEDETEGPDPLEQRLAETTDLLAKAVAQLAANQQVLTRIAEMVAAQPAPQPNPAPVVNVAPNPTQGYTATVTRDHNGFITDMTLLPVRQTFN